MPRESPGPSGPLIGLHVTPDAERRIRFGHPWLYAEAIRTQSRHGLAGDLAVVYDRRNRFLALGLYDPSSPIRMRVLQRHRPSAFNVSWLRARLAVSIDRRAPLVLDGKTTGLRLVHGENDGLPGLVIDRYDTTLVLKLYTAAWVPHLKMVLAALDDVVNSQHIVLRFSRTLQTTRTALKDLMDGAPLKGAPATHPVRFLERSLVFEANVLRGQKTGFFFDQRDNRAMAERLSRGRRVLDVFACTGAFSVAAARGGAREVTSVDTSRPVLEATRRTMLLNRKHPAVARAIHRVIVGEAFEVLSEFAARRTRYDLVILDPPSFAQARKDVPAALAAYQQLARLGLSVLNPDGVLVISCCSGQILAEDFFAAIHRAARQAKRSLRELARTGHPLDHPIGFPEGAYLKCLFAKAAASLAV